MLGAQHLSMADYSGDVDHVDWRSSLATFHHDERGASTVEYAITLLAAAGFAGLLVVLLTSETARGWLTGIIEKALSL